MDSNAFVFWVAVGIASGLVLASILGLWRGLWWYIGLIVKDVRAAWDAGKAKNYVDERIHLNQAQLKFQGCACLVSAIAIVATILFIIVANLTGHWRW